MRTAARLLTTALASVLLVLGCSTAWAASFVPIPAGYVYDPSRGTLHDYCTKSPDNWFSADFRGPCARHDMCFEARRESKATCNARLYADLRTNCDYAYDGLKLSTCYGVAKTYYAAVSIVNP